MRFMVRIVLIAPALLNAGHAVARPVDRTWLEKFAEDEPRVRWLYRTRERLPAGAASRRLRQAAARMTRHLAGVDHDVL